VVQSYARDTRQSPQPPSGAYYTAPDGTRVVVAARVLGTLGELPSWAGCEDALQAGSLPSAILRGRTMPPPAARPAAVFLRAPLLVQCVSDHLAGRRAAVPVIVNVSIVDELLAASVAAELGDDEAGVS